jgi:murein DD-endopeptidase MepM/ murein hydrolase activator NlpD
MNTKRLASAIAFAAIFTASAIGLGIKQASIQPLEAVAQASCDTRVRNESFSLRVGATAGINLRSDRRLSARTNQNLAFNQMVNFDAWGYGESVNDLWNGKPDALWYKLRGQERWVPSAYMVGFPPSRPSTQPNCQGGGSGQINLPFRSGLSMFVCQGYNGPVSHRSQNHYSLDLTVGSRDFGLNNACAAPDGDINKSAGVEVLAPAAGTVMYMPGLQEFVCLQIDSSRSLLIGHMDRRVTNGQRVNQDTVLGTLVRYRGVSPRDYAHIHIEARPNANCAPGISVPFTAANGFQFKGIGDLPGPFTTNTHWKRELRRP